MEDLVGPVHGFWLACYTVAGPDGHHAYAKVCTRRPSDPWDAEALTKIAAGPCATPEDALIAVVLKGRRWLAVARLAVQAQPWSGVPLSRLLRQGRALA